MPGKTYKFNFSDLNLTVSQIERVLGYPEGESHEHIFDIISHALNEAGNICDLRAEYRIFEKVKFDNTGKTVTIDNSTFEIGKIIFGQLKKSDSVALFACTAGPGLGQKSRNSMKTGDMLEGYIYDIIGSEAVEAAADLMQDDMEHDLSLSGRNISNRFSPGYCGWDVAEQHILFNLIPYNYCAIRLTESALMDPEKSISGIIGIGENIKRMPYTCNICDMKNCIYRRRA